MDLPALYSQYKDYIREDQLPASIRENRFARGVWGNPLTIDEFREQWERICHDPALKRLWERRLEAGYEARITEIRKITSRLTASANDSDEDREIKRAVPA